MSAHHASFRGLRIGLKLVSLILNMSATSSSGRSGTCVAEAIVKDDYPGMKWTRSVSMVWTCEGNLK